MAANNQDLDQSIKTLVEIVAKLRHPTEGCPWDLAQTPKSLTPYTIEECAELVQAIEAGTLSDVKGELGDVLFQVVLHSQIAQEQNQFDLHDVVENLAEKMVRRHPHVFNPEHKTTSLDLIWKRWEQTKLSEVANTSLKFCDFPLSLPALQAAAKIGRKSRTIQFDWDSAEAVVGHVESEWSEVKAELEHNNKVRVEAEIGDLLFTVAQLARHLEIDPESALRRANHRILERIEKMLELSGGRMAFNDLTPEQKEELWSRAKDWQNTKPSSDSNVSS